MTRHRLAIHVLFVVLVVTGGSLIGLLNMPGAWYAALSKPSFNPPAWVFGPVWTILYIMIGIAGARTWLDHRATPAGFLWLMQMGFNFLWAPMVFGLDSLFFGLWVIIPMAVSIAAFIKVSWNQDRTSAFLFIPYLVWVSFAAFLNFTLYVMN